MNVQDALAARVSANKFDTTDVMTAGEVQALIAAAMEAPSAFICANRALAVRRFCLLRWASALSAKISSA